MSDRLPKHLDDAAHAARLALRFASGHSLDHYRAGELLRSAVERQVEIVGEACRRALNDTPDLRERVPEMALAVAMRNPISHGYDTVDDVIVFETMTTRFAALLHGLDRELLRFRAT
jgi:uncharacterized protein with HEPN domain